MEFGVEQELERLERSLLAPEIRRSEAAEDLLAEDFLEFGASGRTYNKSQALESMRTEAPADVTLSELTVRMLEPHVGLVTYRALRHGRPPVYTFRSSVWELREGRWQLVHHLSTPTAPPP